MADHRCRKSPSSLSLSSSFWAPSWPGRRFMQRTGLLEMCRRMQTGRSGDPWKEAMPLPAILLLRKEPLCVRGMSPGVQQRRPRIDSNRAKCWRRALRLTSPELQRNSVLRWWKRCPCRSLMNTSIGSGFRPARAWQRESQGFGSGSREPSLTPIIISSWRKGSSFRPASRVLRSVGIVCLRIAAMESGSG